jgi:hypothetical protein
LDDEGLPMAIADSYSPTELCGEMSDRPSVCSREDCIEAIDCAPLSKAVETIIETWYVDDEWWRERIARRYVEVILEGGKHVVLYEDLTGSGWYLQMP